MRDILLDGRLQTCADFVLPGEPMADIGTDHGYLPVYLLQNHVVPFCIAADVREGPLQSARRNAEKYGLTEKISLRLSDGLMQICAEEVKSIVIAGMGGELILRILLETPWLCRTQDPYRLILQPMTSAMELRRGLYENGFAIMEEKTVSSAGKVYSAMAVHYTGVTKTPTLQEAYLGKITPEQPDAAAYAMRLSHALQKQLQGLTIQAQKMGLPEILRRAKETEELLLYLKEQYGKP